jgi:hypothetical protein
MTRGRSLWEFEGWWTFVTSSHGGARWNTVRCEDLAARAWRAAARGGDGYSGPTPPAFQDWWKANWEGKQAFRDLPLRKMAEAAWTEGLAGSEEP